MKVVIADDHRIVRDGLRLILAHDPDIEIVGEVDDGADLLAMLEHEDPEVVLLDVRMPGINGLEVLESLHDRRERVKVVVLTMYDHPQYVRRAVELGAAGYLLKSVDRSELLRALHTVASGESYIQGELTGALVASVAGPSVPDAIDDVDLEGRHLLELLAQGLDNRQLADRLGLTEAAVKSRLRRLYRTLGAERRSEAVAAALRLGLIE